MAKQDPLHFQTYEYEYNERNPDWFWAVGIITIALSITAIILHNVLFAFVIVLSGFVLSLYAARPPKEIDVIIDEKGIRIDDTFYAYPSLESFWIEEHDERSKILIKSQRLLMPYIVISLGDIDPEKISLALNQHLPKIFHSESELQKMMEYLGF